MFLPATNDEMKNLGWTQLDVILVSGDAYIDSPLSGIAVIGRTLYAAGYRVGIISQPDTHSACDIQRLGEPRLFWGVSAGCVDSMVANYTASGRKRRQDDFTPGGENARRPDRATIVYANLIRRAFKNSPPIVLGGIEASLRRIAHYDFWNNRIRKSILTDAKADYLLYGMADRSVTELAKALDSSQTPAAIRGLCYLSPTPPEDAVLLPSYTEVKDSCDAFTEMFHRFYAHNTPASESPLCQRQDSRYLIQNPPPVPLDREELDASADLPYERAVHPFDLSRGAVRAIETIRFSITTHRGCYGECNFCAIAVHQGRSVQSRSRDSILREAKKITEHPLFRGVISDVGGPTANMYDISCPRRASGTCNRRCLFPDTCAHLHPDHSSQIKLLCALRNLPGVKHVFIASGIRHDLVMADPSPDAYINTLAEYHVSGQIKLAPEHSEPAVLNAMGKPGPRGLLDFRRAFMLASERADKKQFLTYYLIAAHPGCSDADMNKLRAFCSSQLKIRPEQVQLFTPTPSTYSTLMYVTGRNPFTNTDLFVEKNPRKRTLQKTLITPPPPKKPSKKHPSR